MLAATTATGWASQVDPLVLMPGRPLEDIEYCIHVANAGAGIRHRALAFYLQEVDSRGLHQLRGFRTATQYAAQRFSIARREARDLLAAWRALLDLPLIDAAFAAGEVCWSKVRELIKVAVAQHEARWLERAKLLHIDELILEVRLAKPGEAPRNRDDRKGLPEIRLSIQAQVLPDVYAKWEAVCRKVRDGCPRTMKDWEIVDAVCEVMLACDPRSPPRGEPPYCVMITGSKSPSRSDADPGTHSSEAAEDPAAAPMAVETESGRVPMADATAETIACDCGCTDPDAEADRKVPPALRRRVLARDGCRCRACGSGWSLQIHHIILVSRGGKTVYVNLITLCRSCHALIHASLLFIQGDFESGWRFLDAEGRDLHEPGSVPAAALDAMSQECRQLVTSQIVRHPASRFEPSGRSEAPPLRERPCILQGQVLSDAGASAERGHEPSDRTFVVPPQAPAQSGTLCQPCPEDSGGLKLSDMVGQDEVVKSLRLAVGVALKRDQPLGHVLLCGAAGLGKSTLARAVAAEMGAPVNCTTATLLEEPRDMVRLLAGLARHNVLFLDEIHALPTRVALVLYEALTDRRLSIPVANEPGVRTTVMPLAPFTLIGATTDEGDLPEPFLSRFEHRLYLRFYGDVELTELIGRAAAREALPIDASAATVLARVSRGTPREALRLLRQAQAEAIAAGCDRIDQDIAESTLERLQIDARGLGPLDRQYLEVLRSRGPGRSPRTLERLHEPYIFRMGLATTTPNGRVALSA